MIEQKNQSNPIERIVSGLSPLYKRQEQEDSKGHTFEEESKFGDISVVDVEAFLRSFNNTVSVKSVEKDKVYQGRGTDLIWEYMENGKIRTTHIEVKGDKWCYSGNIFNELISNMTKKTPGWFRYTKADYIYYYFPETRELNVIDMKKFREWWATIDENDFPIAHGVTLVRKGSNETYKSEGRLVSKKLLNEEIAMKQYILLNP